jgi:protein O-GlcNAc transferase
MNRISTDQAVELATQHQRAGRVADAESLCRQVLAVNGNHAGGLHLLGMLAYARGDFDASMPLLERAAAAAPGDALFQADLGVLNDAIGRSREAIAAFRRALQIRPDSALILSNFSSALRSAGELDAAIDAARRAVSLKPDLVEAYGNLGNALGAKGLADEAIEAYQQCIRLRPNLAISHYNLANVYQKKGELDAAIASYQEAIRLFPNFAEAHSNLGNALQGIGQLDEAIAECRRAVALKPGLAEAHGNVIFTLQFHPASDPQSIQAELRQWNAQHAEPLKKFIRPHANDRNPDRALRVGYVSDDFYIHASALFLLPLFRHHYKRQFEIFCYSEHPHADDVTRKMREEVHGWRSTIGRPDAEVAAMMRDDKIDILVDLKLHTAANRLLVFAHKPAPVQVTWLGYPGSTGMETIDYRLTDPYIDPPNLDDAFYTERSVRLPETFWCYDPLELSVEVSPAPCLANKFITFGCLNLLKKINDEVLSAWAQILNSIENSRLLIMAPEGSARELVLHRMGRAGIEAERVNFVPRQTRPDYLRTYHQIDIGLDTFPYNGHTTSLDSLWMGVPVVTLSGRTAVGRAGVSQLTNLGMTQFIGRSVDEYVQIARNLAADVQRLQEIRSTLRARMEASPLMDAARFARNIESAYREMWRTWCAGQMGK